MPWRRESARGILKEDAEKLAADLKAAGAEVEDCQHRPESNAFYVIIFSQ